MSRDESRPRSIMISIEEDGEEWVIDLKRNRVEPTDPDVCSMLAELRAVIDGMHSESHVAKDLRARCN